MDKTAFSNHAVMGLVFTCVLAGGCGKPGEKAAIRKAASFREEVLSTMRILEGQTVDLDKKLKVAGGGSVDVFTAAESEDFLCYLGRLKGILDVKARYSKDSKVVTEISLRKEKIEFRELGSKKELWDGYEVQISWGELAGHEGRRAALITMKSNTLVFSIKLIVVMFVD